MRRNLFKIAQVYMCILYTMYIIVKNFRKISKIRMVSLRNRKLERKKKVIYSDVITY